MCEALCDSACASMQLLNRNCYWLPEALASPLCAPCSWASWRGAWMWRCCTLSARWMMQSSCQSWLRWPLPAISKLSKGSPWCEAIWVLLLRGKLVLDVLWDALVLQLFCKALRLWYRWRKSPARQKERPRASMSMLQVTAHVPLARQSLVQPRAWRIFGWVARAASQLRKWAR